MDPVIALLLGLVIGAALGAAALALLRRGASAGSGDAARVAAERRWTEERMHWTRREGELAAELAAATATAEGLQRQLGGSQQQVRELMERQRSDQASAQQRERGESRVLEALAPVAQSLADMQLKVTDLEHQRRTQHGELSQQLRSATESEERLRATADSLASALRNNSTRGVWGETQLRSVVEAAGLLQRVDFDVQSSISGEGGIGRPDMIVRLPGGKSIAVDAKVPFNAYLDASAIPATASDAELARRDALLRQHVKAVRDHISALGDRRYWTGLPASPEMVIAFIPSESLVSSALEADPTIMEFAFGKRVALASPVTLWSVLKTVAFSWQQDVLTEDAKALFDLSRELYTRLSTLGEHVDKLGRTITTSVRDYNRLVGTLESRVLVSARKLGDLDETTVLAPASSIEDVPREVTAHELTGRVTADR